MDKNSFLPPLHKQKNNTQQSPEVSAHNLEFKKQILQFYPQVQNLEKNVISLKQQVPVNISKALLDLKQQTYKTLEYSKPSVTKENNDFAQQELNELEKRLKEKIQVLLQTKQKQGQYCKYI